MTLLLLLFVFMGLRPFWRWSTMRTLHRPRWPAVQYLEELPPEMVGSVYREGAVTQQVMREIPEGIPWSVQLSSYVAFVLAGLLPGVALTIVGLLAVWSSHPPKGREGALAALALLASVVLWKRLRLLSVEAEQLYARTLAAFEEETSDQRQLMDLALFLLCSIAAWKTSSIAPVLGLPVLFGSSSVLRSLGRKDEERQKSIAVRLRASTAFEEPPRSEPPHQEQPQEEEIPARRATSSAEQG